MTESLTKKGKAPQTAGSTLLTASVLPPGVTVKAGQATVPGGIKGLLALVSQFVTVGGDFA